MRLKALAAGTLLMAGAIAVSTASTAHAATIRYEAEAAPATCDGTIDSNHAGFSGSGFCNGRNATGAAAQFTVNTTTGGPASAVIRFANGTTTSRSASFIVNGTTIQTLSFEGTGAWTTWSSKIVNFNASAGNSTIRISPTSSGGLPNIDFLDFVVEGPPPPTNTLFVATNGNDGNPGTQAQPLLTIARAVTLAQPGTTIMIRGGTYSPSTNIQLTKN